MTRWRSLFLPCVMIAAALLTLFQMRGRVAPSATLQGVVHPALTIPRARFSGVVGEVLVKPGDRVEKGRLLLRFEAKELNDRLAQLRKAAQAANAAVDGGAALSQIPNGLRSYLYEMHPETIKAEREYVDALGAGGDRLRRATEERTLVRRRLATLFSARAGGTDSRLYLAELTGNIADVEKLLRQTEFVAPSDAIVELLEARPGDRFQLGQPVAVLVSSSEYAVELRPLQSAFWRLQPGMSLQGRIDETKQRVQARVESIAMRKMPVIARDNLQMAEEPVAQLRIVAATPLRAGSIATFQVP